ncbi:polysaccharide biosynthesis protein [Algibacter sp. 2305UL17-15]|uniref:polysaccharide biosynthesis protein n=1 Tax=Algibacter sp. 2305UL17-15 TaxID=3231268 RepID=UPI003458D41F
MRYSSRNRIKQLLDNSGLLGSKSINNFQYNSYDFSDETILITGAAGSIGSGLTHHLLASNFKKLIVIDNAETPLFYLKCEVEAKKIENVEFILMDIRDNESMAWLFETYNPSLIFHTAAYKHVELMEQNPYEAVKLNIHATKCLAKLSVKHNVKKFVFISTDKAVNPIGVMGMTKFIAENYLNVLNNDSKTAFVTTRFGNIFGSNGSVVPLFLKQLNSGQPLTVKDKKASRFFIDKRKACDLILTVAQMDTHHYDLVSFDMNSPIKIIDLAKVMLSSVSDELKTHIEITNLSSEEKLTESMISKNEQLIPSTNKDIYFVKKKSDIQLNLKPLKNINTSIKNEDIKLILKHISYS